MPQVKAGRVVRGREYVKTSLGLGVVERGLMADICLETGETKSALVERLIRSEFERIGGWTKGAVMLGNSKMAQLAKEKLIEQRMAVERLPREIDDFNPVGVESVSANPAFEESAVLGLGTNPKGEPR